ncbi:hypothetical protein V8E54_001407 [Elaphomyces granulatus]
MANRTESYVSSFVENVSFSMPSPSAPTSVEDRTSARITRVIEHTFKSLLVPISLRLYNLFLTRNKTQFCTRQLTSAGKSLLALLCLGWVLCIIPPTRLGEEEVPPSVTLKGSSFMISLTLQTAGKNFAMPFFTSPEIAISPLFKEAVLDIVARLRLVDLDELHCIMTWGNRHIVHCTFCATGFTWFGAVSDAPARYPQGVS